MSKTRQDRLIDEGMGFELYIQFEPNSPQPEKVFSATSALIKAFGELDSVLLSSISTSIKTEFRLQEVEGGSLRVWLARALLEVNDANMAEAEWWKVLGKFLVYTKYDIIQWLLGKNSIKTADEIAEVARIANARAVETGILQLPSYAPVNQEKLTGAIHSITKAVEMLGDGEGAEYRTSAGSTKIPAISVISSEEYVYQVQEILHVDELKEELLVRKADFLGDSLWWFMRQGEKVSMRIEDEAWLSRFHAGEVDLRPGYSMRVVIRENVTRLQSGVKVQRTITNVLEVCPGNDQCRRSLPGL